jgi:hypothetical protein
MRNHPECTCETETHDPHPCPYAEEFKPPNEPVDEEHCTCCPYCESQCAMDI